MTQEKTEKKPLIIEGVCSGNSGRSPVFELIGNNELVRFGCDDLYKVTSSGTLVDKIAEGKVPFKKKVEIVNKALKRDMFRGSDYGFIKKAIEADNEEDQKALDVYYNQAVRTFVAEEHAWRAKALKKFNIPGKVKTTPTQTVARPDTIAVLAMDSGNRDRVKKIYDASEYKPTIAVLSQYVTENPDAQLPDAFGTNEKTYFALIEQMIPQTKKALGRRIAEYHLLRK